MTVAGTRIESKRAIKYLGVIIDDRLNFKEHVEYIGEKPSVTQRALARMMAKFGGRGPFKRKIIFGGSNVDHAICLPNIVEYGMIKWIQGSS